MSETKNAPEGGQRARKTLISLEQHNAAVRERMEQQFKPKPNGIACPSCGEELCDDMKPCVLLSFPATQCIFCPKCGYTGGRLL